MQSRISDQPAFILHRRDYRESSLILEIFSEQYGRVSVLVNAAKKRRDVGCFQICNRLSVGWSGRSELKVLTRIESRVLAVAAEFYPGVFYVNELLMLLLPKHQAHVTLFGQYQHLLLTLAHADDVKSALAPALRIFEMELLTAVGLMPSLTQPSRSTDTIDATAFYYFDPSDGLCPARDESSLNFSGATLLAIEQRRFDDPQIARAAKMLLRQLIDYNLQGRALQSRKFYQQVQK